MLSACHTIVHLSGLNYGGMLMQIVRIIYILDALPTLCTCNYVPYVLGKWHFARPWVRNRSLTCHWFEPHAYVTLSVFMRPLATKKHTHTIFLVFLAKTKKKNTMFLILLDGVSQAPKLYENE